MHETQIELNGSKLSLETGRLAKQADGAVLVKHGGTMVLSTATISDEPREGIDFFPLTVDYEERLYAVGRIPGGFIKREGKPTDKAILAARLTDRPLRPLFDKSVRNAVHIVSTVLSVDQNCPPETLSIIGASAALSLSKIPFNGPVAAVAVGLVDGKVVVSPNTEQLKVSTLQLTVAGTAEAIMMVEAGAQEVPHHLMLEAILTGHEKIKEIVAMEQKLVEMAGAPQKMDLPQFLPREDIEEQVKEFSTARIKQAIATKDKAEREQHMKQVHQETLEHFTEIFPDNERDITAVYEKLEKETMRSMILKEGVRPDGRGINEIRPISCEVGLLPSTHGSGLFTRGQTQVLDICTLAQLRDMQILDGLGIEESKRFIHHYNFPPYSVGEAGFMRGPGRREIGHGALAERALLQVIPNEDEFPYTIRLVSEVLESNGSSSMGSVCAGCLSMMDTGVPIKKMVAGIAMGLIKEGEDVAVLTDIQGMEDFLGDMDFKIAGTTDGITALQMDIKITGINREILEKALVQGKEGYMFIMGKMAEALDKPRPELSPIAPRVITMKISVDKIRDIIGPGGKIINKIIADTGAEINIEDDGRIYIGSVDLAAGEKAQKIIETLVKDVVPGEVYTGKVVRVERYGAFVELLPGKDGLCHISQLDVGRVGKTEDIAKLGDMLTVKVLGIDDKGRIDISRKEYLLDQDPALRAKAEAEKEERNRNRFSRDRSR